MCYAFLFDERLIGLMVQTLAECALPLGGAGRSGGTLDAIRTVHSVDSDELFVLSWAREPKTK
jgi:hypothetical protein